MQLAAPEDHIFHFVACSQNEKSAVFCKVVHGAHFCCKGGHLACFEVLLRHTLIDNMSSRAPRTMLGRLSLLVARYDRDK